MTAPAHLVRAASERFRPAGRFAYHFARSKLARDPVFTAILAHGLLRERARILDLGCGQGLLTAWLVTASAADLNPDWPRQWPQAPRPTVLRGIELDGRAVARARAALASHADFAIGDVRTAEFGSADGVVMLDVLHYIAYADQLAVLDRARTALGANGVLLLRINDADGGLRFQLAKWVDQMVLLFKGHGLRRVHCRPLQEWRAVLARCGFDVVSLPMSAGTPFANFLLVASPR